MSVNSLIVDCIRGNDANINNGIDLEKRVYKTLDEALDNMKQKEKIFINPGIYTGIDFECNDHCFEFSLEGTGISSELSFFTYVGETNCSLKNLRLNEIKLKVVKSNIDFSLIDFTGNNRMICENYPTTSDETITELEFNECIFGINYQLIINKGIFSITFKNCKFRGRRTLPIILAKKAELKVSITLCNISEIPLVFNENSSVYIYHSNCNFDRLSEGKECACYSSAEDMISKESRVFSVFEEPQKQRIVESCKSVRVRCINTDEYSIIRLDPRTEFLRLVGLNSITVILPCEQITEVGHGIEIVLDCPFFKIDEKIYYHNVKARLLDDGWFIYKST